MPDEQRQFDERMEALSQRVERLKRFLPPEAPASVRKARAYDPLDTVQIILWLFAVNAGLLLVQDAVALFFIPDGHVFVAEEGQKFAVWPDVEAYEAGTGKRWMDQPAHTTELLATYHDAKRDQAKAGGVCLLLVLLLSAIAIRRLRQGRSRRAAREASSSSGTDQRATADRP